MDSVFVRLGFISLLAARPVRCSRGTVLFIYLFILNVTVHARS